VLQLALVAVGMAIALPFVLDAVSGLWGAWSAHRTTFHDRGGLVPPFTPHGVQWTPAAVVARWDVSAMLLLGGIPWNCYFQRVLACETPAQARLTSILAGAMTIALVGPPLLLGTAAAVYPWPAEARTQLAAIPAQALPLLLGIATPSLVALLGLGAIVGAVTSSFSASVLSAASMVTWNGVRAFVRRMSEAAVQRRPEVGVSGTSSTSRSSGLDAGAQRLKSSAAGSRSWLRKRWALASVTTGCQSGR
jgi:high affinity choline transporter 7